MTWCSEGVTCATLAETRAPLRLDRLLACTDRVTVEAVLLHESVECGAIYSGDAGGLRHVAVGTLHEPRKVTHFEVGQHLLTDAVVGAVPHLLEGHGCGADRGDRLGTVAHVRQVL